jgi:hypothetical protein
MTIMSCLDDSQIEILRNRSTQDVFQDHLRQRQGQALEEDLARNYAVDVVVFYTHGLHHGHEGVRQATRLLQGYRANAEFVYKATLVAGEMAYLEWSTYSNGVKVEEGADSFLIRNGQIVARTIHCMKI